MMRCLLLCVLFLVVLFLLNRSKNFFFSGRGGIPPRTLLISVMYIPLITTLASVFKGSCKNTFSSAIMVMILGPILAFTTGILARLAYQGVCS